jgi:uncharacterized protein YqhQ
LKSPENTAAPDPSKGEFLQYGGQAVIEGVMMRSPRYFAVACRKPDGSIVVQREEVDKGILRRLKWLNKPLLRGTLALLDAMVLGSRALSYSSRVQLQEENLSPNQEPPHHTLKERAAEELHVSAASGASGPPLVVPTAAPKSNRINDIAIGGTIVMSLLMGFFIFRFIPTILTDLIGKSGIVGDLPKTALDPGRVKLNAVDGLIRVAFFFTYILLISRMAGIRAVFQYHGAEHKAINTMEARQDLTRANALQASRIHPRCGTSFIIVVMTIDFLICLLLPRPIWYLRILLHLAVLPPVAGIAYEVIKFAGKFRRNALVMAAFAPGMWSQYLTTREPTPDQVDVALAALHSVLEAEGHTIPKLDSAYTIPNPDEPAAVTA